MNRQSDDTAQDWEKKSEAKAGRREAKGKGKMRVSGARVKELLDIIKKKK
jgi:hypothetical protein